MELELDNSCAKAQDGELDDHQRLHHLLLLSVCYSATITLFKISYFIPALLPIGPTLFHPSHPMSSGVHCYFCVPSVELFIICPVHMTEAQAPRISVHEAQIHCLLCPPPYGFHGSSAILGSLLLLKSCPAPYAVVAQASLDSAPPVAVLTRSSPDQSTQLSSLISVGEVLLCVVVVQGLVYHRADESIPTLPITLLHIELAVEEDGEDTDFSEGAVELQLPGLFLSIVHLLAIYKPAELDLGIILTNVHHNTRDLGIPRDREYILELWWEDEDG
ncbi:hypothetical protein U0070_003671 [Myodes glareolus]|uniref:Uncharacterized protein n=1 Tax=Myodes glareolus TaxID=447135 RepID=A0AAW0H6V9_MYOGA